MTLLTQTSRRQENPSEPRGHLTFGTRARGLAFERRRAGGNPRGTRPANGAGQRGGAACCRHTETTPSEHVA
jgi:hypothetical protein